MDEDPRPVTPHHVAEKKPKLSTRSSSGEVGIRVPFFSVVDFSRGTLPTKKGSKGTTGGPSLGWSQVVSM